METLQQFKQRTSYIWQPMPEGALTLNPNLAMKVNDEGRFHDFYGDTVVYLLTDEIKERLAEFQKLLLNECSDLFAEPLIKDTFHLTLHDLNNGPAHDELFLRMKETRQKVIELMRSWRDDSTQIHLKSTRVFNMVNTSVVLCFEPESEQDCQHLMHCYESFQSIVELSYPLTPHITLAYYNAPYISWDENGNAIKGRIPAHRIQHLSQVIEHLNQKEPIHLTLTVNDLAYQVFTSMNHYVTDFSLEFDQRKTLLIVEDAAFMRLMMKDYLKDEPIFIDEAACGADLIHYLDEKEPDYIILDNTLPDLNSIDLLEIIHQEHPNICVMYASTTPVCKDKLTKLGASAFLSKPIQKDTFLKEIHHLMNR